MYDQDIVSFLGLSEGVPCFRLFNLQLPCYFLFCPEDTEDLPVEVSSKRVNLLLCSRVEAPGLPFVNDKSFSYAVTEYGDLGEDSD